MCCCEMLNQVQHDHVLYYCAAEQCFVYLAHDSRRHTLHSGRGNVDCRTFIDTNCLFPLVVEKTEEGVACPCVRIVLCLYRTDRTDKLLVLASNKPIYFLCKVFCLISQIIKRIHISYCFFSKPYFIINGTTFCCIFSFLNQPHCLLLFYLKGF